MNGLCEIWSHLSRNGMTTGRSNQARRNRGTEENHRRWVEMSGASLSGVSWKIISRPNFRYVHFSRSYCTRVLSATGIHI